MNRLPTMIWLALLWVVLWRDISVANVLSGVAVGVAVELAQPGDRENRRQHRIAPVALVSFIGWYVWKLVEANLIVAREVVSPKSRIHTGIIEVELPPCSRVVFTIIADAVILTPGTVIIEAHRHETPVIYVHVLHLYDVDQARADVMELANRILAAFPRLAEPAPDTVEDR